MIRGNTLISGRPKVVVFEQIAEGHGHVLIDYDPLWKSQRKFGLSILRG